MARDATYREAEERIEQSLKRGARKLDLSHMGLTELPESLGLLTQLQTLSAWGNELTSLPESLGQLTQLQTLDVSDNRLTSLPESLGWLTQLQKLDLDSNQLISTAEVDNETDPSESLVSAWK